jgi:hypothetical protein
MHVPGTKWMPGRLLSSARSVVWPVALFPAARRDIRQVQLCLHDQSGGHHAQ